VKHFVVHRYLVVKHRNLVYTPFAYAKTTYHNLDWDDFKDFYVLIQTSKDLKAYASHIYSNLVILWVLG
jgi:hypothetical protein